MYYVAEVEEFDLFYQSSSIDKKFNEQWTAGRFVHPLKLKSTFNGQFFIKLGRLHQVENPFGG